MAFRPTGAPLVRQPPRNKKILDPRTVIVRKIRAVNVQGVHIQLEVERGVVRACNGGGHRYWWWWCPCVCVWGGGVTAAKAHTHITT
jgi:hypothetical protein